MRRKQHRGIGSRRRCRTRGRLRQRQRAARDSNEQLRRPPPRPPGGAATTAAGGALKPVKLQLQWFTQAQFAGYFAAVDQGYYKDDGLDVEHPRRRRRHRAADRARPGQGRLRHRLGAEGAASPASTAPPSPTSPRSSSGRARCRCRFKDKDITDAGRPQGQEGRQLGLRQRVRALRRHDEGRPRTRRRTSRWCSRSST